MTQLPLIKCWPVTLRLEMRRRLYRGRRVSLMHSSDTVRKSSSSTDSSISLGVMVEPFRATRRHVSLLSSRLEVHSTCHALSYHVYFGGNGPNLINAAILL